MAALLYLRPRHLELNGIFVQLVDNVHRNEHEEVHAFVEDFAMVHSLDTLHSSLDPVCFTIPVLQVHHVSVYGMREMFLVVINTLGTIRTIEPLLFEQACVQLIFDLSFDGHDLAQFLQSDRLHGFDILSNVVQLDVFG